MILGVQIIGILFGLFMTYLTLLYYRKGDYKFGDFAVWLVVWISFILVMLFPQGLYGIMGQLKIKRTVDFIIMCGFLFFSVVIFYLYALVRKNQRKIEHLVRKQAFDKANEEYK
ncbi:DUF2304 domain-containing protein [Candidatus Woesearchaeota archaeon]|nr:DUF2304 domain-containing protein [Candidatus Woesearchaeota archaeon]